MSKQYKFGVPVFLVIYHRYEQQWLYVTPIHFLDRPQLGKYDLDNVAIADKHMSQEEMAYYLQKGRPVRFIKP